MQQKFVILELLFFSVNKNNLYFEFEIKAQFQDCWCF